MKVPSGHGWRGLPSSAPCALMLLHNRMGAEFEPVAVRFFSEYQSNQIAQATINYNLQSGNLIELSATYYKRTGRNHCERKRQAVVIPFTTKALLTEKMKDVLLPPAGKLEVSETSPMLLNMIWTVAPFLLIAFVLVFLHPPDQNGRKGALSFGKARRGCSRGTEQTMFKDVRALRGH